MGCATRWIEAHPKLLRLLERRGQPRRQGQRRRRPQRADQSLPRRRHRREVEDTAYELIRATQLRILLIDDLHNAFTGSPQAVAKSSVFRSAVDGEWSVTTQSMVPSASVTRFLGYAWSR